MRHDRADDRSKRWLYRLTESSASLSVHPIRRSRGGSSRRLRVSPRRSPLQRLPRPAPGCPAKTDHPAPRRRQDRAPRMLPGCTGVPPEQGENPLLRVLEATWKSRDERTRSPEEEAAGQRRRVAGRRLLAKPGSPPGCTLRRPRDPGLAQ